MNSEPVTFVNIFDTTPDQQHQLVDLLTSAGEEVIRHRPGFISLTLLASHDGRRVINVARWESQAEAVATQSDPQAADYAARSAAIANALPGLYRVAARMG